MSDSIITNRSDTISWNATATSNDILENKFAYGKNGIKIPGTIPSKTAQTFIPTTSNQIITANQYLAGNQTILGDQNLIAANIREGIPIFNIIGTYKGIYSGGAVIRCYTTTGSTVTITKDNITKTCTSAEAQIDNSNIAYCFYYFFLSSSELGAWTVTATNGDKNRSVSVAATIANREYDINLDYDLYIIKNGLQILTLTKTGNGSIIQNAANVDISGATNVAVLGYYAIDLTPYSTLYLTQTGGKNGSFSDVPYFGVSSATPTINTGSGAVSNTQTRAKITYNSTQSINITNYTGTKYVWINNGGGTSIGGSGHCYVTQFWLKAKS